MRTAGRGAYTTVASGSNAVNTSTFAGSGTLNVASTAGFPSTGKVVVNTGTSPAVISYTGTTATTFTGCTTLAGGGALATGGLCAPSNANAAGTTTLYLGLYKWTGTSGAGAGQEPNDDATLPANVAEVSTGGYSRKSVAVADWSSTTAGALGTASQIAVPTSGQGPYTWTASGAAFGELCAWGLFDASTGGTLLSSGPLTDSSGTSVSRTINDGDSFTFDSNNQIIMRLGDPAPAGTYTSRTVPT